MKQENDVIVDSREVNKKRKSSLFGIVFLIWFFGSIFGLMYFSKINVYYTVMIFGQYFLVFGMIPILSTKGKERLIGVPFVLVGACAVIIPYLMMHPELINANIVWDSVIPLLLILAFVIAGLAMVVLPIKHKKELESRCTELVSATIVDYKSTRGENGRVYSPIYSFYFNNREYKASNEMYSNIGLKEVGTMVDLKVNPNNPYEFLDGAVHIKFIVILGILFLFVSVPVLIYILNTLQFAA